MSSSVIDKLTFEILVPEHKVLKGIEIFYSGTHKDSQGLEKDFTPGDLDLIMDAFEANAPPDVPIKLGHVTDEFAAEVAAAFDVPQQVMVGEGDTNKGAARLGRVIGLQRSKDKLFATLQVHPKTAELVTSGLFVANSPEMQFDREQDGRKHPLSLSALSLLGAQRPALADNKPLQAGVMMGEALSGFAETETSNFGQGSMSVSPGEASAGESGESLWNVPIVEKQERGVRGRGTFIQATVSAPDSVTAGRVALRVAENFLLNVTGPLGSIVGNTLGFLVGRRLILGRAKKVNKGVAGFLKWKSGETEEQVTAIETEFEFEDDPDMEDYIVLSQEVKDYLVKNKGVEFAARDVEGKTYRDVVDAMKAVTAAVGEKTKATITFNIEGVGTHTQTLFPGNITGIFDRVSRDMRKKWEDLELNQDKIPKIKITSIKLEEGMTTKSLEDLLKLAAPEGVDPAKWAACLTKAREDGKEDPEGHCRGMMAEEGDKEAAELVREVNKELGLSEWVDRQTTLEAVKKFKLEQAKFSEAEGKTAERVAKLEETIAIQQFAEDTSQLTLVVGKPDEMAKQLFEAGEVTAKILLAGWKREQKLAEDAGLTKSVLLGEGAGDDDPETLHDAISKFLQEDSHKEMTYSEAYPIVAKANPDLK